tara:strand:+ start:1102 stop:1314 length:213 start_codon:yes stop_codon:yes gene_type:complete
MARRTAAMNKAITNKISKLKGEGYASKQATAIAMRMYRDGEIKPRKSTAKKPARTTRRTTARTTRRTRRK